MMNNKQAVKLSYIVNTWILAYVIILMILFYRCQATFLVYFSIPTIAVYLLSYFLIYKNKLTIYVWLVYFWILLYMNIATICLGYSSGFHLYAISLIPVIFYTEYMAYQLHAQSVKAIVVGVVIAATYAIGSGYAIYNGAIYTISRNIETMMMVFNALVVLSFLIAYSLIMIRMITYSEEQLRKMAMVDRLTGLYNRHYMIKQIEQQVRTENPVAWIAMMDLDGFKGINDRFGHNAGDAVLVHFSELLTEICDDCICSRWGGEEFLVLAKNHVDKSVLEKLRLAVCEKPFLYENAEIQVSVTVGASDYQDDMTIDHFIQDADDKLYIGKKNGKNIVIL